MPPESLASRPRLFEYEACRSDGSRVRGHATATGELELDQTLEREGLTLVSAVPSKAGRGLESVRMPRHDLVAFTNQLATMIQAGVPLLQGLKHIAQHGRSRAARRVVDSILRHIESGASLSDALAAHPAVFPETYVAMVRSGEMSGALPEVLRRQGAYLDWMREVRGITQQALIYPTALLLAITGLVIILITFLIPRLVGLFPGGHEDLPSQTKFVMAVSDFARANWKGFIGLALAGAAAHVVMLRVPRTRVQLSQLLLRIPRLGRLVDMLAVARFATTAASLHKSGCDIIKTLEIASGASGNAFMRSRFGLVLERVRGGATIHEAMDDTGGLDPYLVQLIGVGEASGSLGDCLEYIADSYNAEVPRVVKWTLGLIEPMVLIVGGIVVALLLLAAILPIFKIYETLG